ncbi:hypothetical protein E1B28_003927 [Marasmius oreades]|uniref:Uncharacterized protein n=1 Tax=Marasmius oreades TaxID=181124 RepID=A0A9P7UXJ1_9AGAR|nr:uncharacterized protein E1B28_003927 [Marasmius oreades]KAG7096497.1 hypothetical protein E1B28_003927 [Marasmius oreades]
MDTDVLRLWTTLDDHLDDSEDELDQLEVNDVISAKTLLTSSSKLNSPTKQRTPQKSAHVTLKLKNSNTVESRVSTPTSPKSIKRATTTSSENSARRSRELIIRTPPSRASEHRATKRIKIDNSNQVRSLNASVHESSNISPFSSSGQVTESSLADALSSAFNKNAEVPYPSPRALVGTSRTSLKRGFNHGTITTALTGNQHQDYVADLNGPLKIKRKGKPATFSQEKIDEYLDVHILPIHSNRESHVVDGDISMTDVNDAGMNLSTPHAESGVNTKESRVWQTVTFNLRHVMASRTRERHARSPSTKTMPSYEVSGQSYTAMYLERAGQWLGDHVSLNGPEMEGPETNYRRESMINPSPQIPRTGLSDVAPAMNDWDDQTSSSFDTDDVMMLLDANTTSPPKSDDERSVTFVNVGLAGPVKSDSNHGAEAQSERSRTPSLSSGSSFVNALTLLQRLVKGKTRLSDEEVHSTRTFLELLGSSGQSVYSNEFQTSTPEDRACFLQLVSRLSSRTASTLDLPGVPEGEARLIKKHARIVAQKYDQTSIENDH